jgi:citrate synthase
MAQRKIQSNMGWSSADRVIVRGRDLCQDVLGKMSFGDFAFLELTGRTPTEGESGVFNAMLCVLVEHGMTPTAMVTRLTYLGAPESSQAAIAAGLCGMGTTFAGTAEGAARVLQEARKMGGQEAPDVGEVASAIVKRHLEQRKPVPGLGHPVHKPIDPRTPVLFSVAEESGLSGYYVSLMKQISVEAERQLGKPGKLPVNATGAIGALASELGIDWRLCRGIAVVSRAAGLLGHLAEELENPIALDMWHQIEDEATSHIVGENGQ